MMLATHQGLPSLVSSHSSLRGTSAIKDASEFKKQVAIQNAKNVTLLTHPFKTISIFLALCAKMTVSAAKRTPVLFFTTLLVATVLITAKTFHTELQAIPELDTSVQVLELVFEVLEWILLGFLSSFGMGFGLHTFVLFLAPAIVRFINEQQACNVWDVYHNVWWWSLSWGFGTAIGELPPYFSALHAKRRGIQLSELEELHGLEASAENPTSIADKIKSFVVKALPKLNFFSILLFASVPNPLFDFAGISCGHMEVPFWIFFGATAIGKAVIKSNLQTAFILFVFCRQGSVADAILASPALQTVDELVQSYAGVSVSAKLHAFWAQMHSSAGGDALQLSDVLKDYDWKEALAAVARNPLGLVSWNSVVIVIVAAFIVSTIDSMVQHSLVEEAGAEDSVVEVQSGKLSTENDNSDDSE